MNFYQVLVDFYNSFLALFPVPVQWLVTLIILVALISTFIGLVRQNALFVIVLIVLLPVLIPVLQHFFTDLYNFFLYLFGQLKSTSPR